LKRFRQLVQLLGHVEDAPARVALAFAIGVWIAFFPILGIHTGLALAIAFLFRLNRVAILAGAWLNNPWTLAPMYMAGTILGCGLLGISTEGLDSIDWSLHGWAFYSALLESLRPYVVPFIVGNSVLGLAGAILAYFLLRTILERRRQVAGQEP
jgi:uncharacterized protein (DUF2062 family)